MNDKIIKYIGSAIYACEGTKERRDPRRKNGIIKSIEFTNSEPEIIGMFSLFLRKHLNVDESRLRGQLFYYPNQAEEKLKEFWSKKSDIPINQFQKSILMKSKIRFKTSPWGTFKIRYTSKEEFEKLQKMIKKTWRDAGVV